MSDVPSPEPEVDPTPVPAPDPAPDVVAPDVAPDPAPAPPERVRFESSLYPQLLVFDLAGNQIQFADGLYITQDPSWIEVLDATPDVTRAG